MLAAAPAAAARERGLAAPPRELGDVRVLGEGGFQYHSDERLPRAFARAPRTRAQAIAFRALSGTNDFPSGKTFDMGLLNDETPLFHVVTESPHAGKLQCFRCPRLGRFDFAPGMNFAWNGFANFSRDETWLFNHKAETLFYEAVLARRAAEVFRGKPSRWREHRPSVSAFALPDPRRVARCAAAKPPLGAGSDGEARSQPWFINWTFVMREMNGPCMIRRQALVIVPEPASEVK